jgi:hypothetical protein
LKQTTLNSLGIEGSASFRLVFRFSGKSLKEMQPILSQPTVPPIRAPIVNANATSEHSVVSQAPAPTKVQEPRVESASRLEETPRAISPSPRKEMSLSSPSVDLPSVDGSIDRELQLFAPPNKSSLTRSMDNSFRIDFDYTLGILNYLHLIYQCL